MMNSLVQKEDLLSATAHPGLGTLTAHPRTSGRQGQIEQLAGYFLRTVSQVPDYSDPLRR